MEELKRVIDDSEITKEDDALWPPPDRVGRQVSKDVILPTLIHIRPKAFYLINILTSLKSYLSEI